MNVADPGAAETVRAAPVIRGTLGPTYPETRVPSGSTRAAELGERRAGARAAKCCVPGAVRVLGVDLAWGEGNATKAANETGVAALDGNGDILNAGWTRCGCRR